MENKFTKKDIDNYQRTIGHYALPPDGIRTRRGTKKTKIKWRNIIPALFIGAAVAFLVRQAASYCCGLMHTTMLVPVWVIIDSIIFVIVSMVAVMRINAFAAQKVVNRKSDCSRETNV